MALPLMSDMTTNVRANIRDSSATSANQHFTDAQLRVFLNAAVRLIQRKFYPRVALLGSMVTFSTGGSGAYIQTTTATNIRKIHALIAATTTQGTMPSWKDLQEFLSIRQSQQGASFSTPTANQAIYWTAFRSATTTEADSGKWSIMIYPQVATNTAYSGIVEYEDADLTASDSPDMPQEGQTMAEHLASYWTGKIVGRDYADMFLNTYPELKELAAKQERESAKEQGRG